MLLCGCQRRVTVQTNTVDRFEITLKVCATNNLVTRIFDVETNTGLCQLETQDVPLKCYRYTICHHCCREYIDNREVSVSSRC